MLKKLFILIFIFTLVPVFFVCASTDSVKKVQTVENTKPIKILLVPGHDNETVGSQFKLVKETDMNLAVATRIFDLLKKDKRFEVYITRDNSSEIVPGEYTKEFSDYFNQHRDEIIAFKEEAKKTMQENINKGGFVKKVNTPHHSVSQDVSVRLYGVNKWANDNKIDAVIHIHFNDNVRANRNLPGKFKGFNIYVPDSQFLNAKGSMSLAVEVFKQLNKKYITSTYEPEKGGLTTEQKLIAIGANNTLSASVRSILIEYGYIYEKKFRKKVSREQAYKNMASLTALGIKNYFLNK